MKRGKPTSGAITEHRKKASPRNFFSRLPPPSRRPRAAVTIEDIYEDDTREELLGETEPMELDKGLRNDVSTGIPNYGRPATTVLDLLPTASAVL